MFKNILRWRIGLHHNYRMGGDIGRGGMSFIYKAVHLKTKEAAAVKILFPHYTVRRKKVERLLQEEQIEGEIARKLSHPNVVNTFISGKCGSSFYFIMEYIDGMPLHRLIEYTTPKLEQKLGIMRQTAEGLYYIHRMGIIHRDICPANILVSKEGKVKIIDFGLAVWKRGRIRKMAERAGTPTYMSPEQIRALPADERSDIYSYSAAMYTLLCGRPPFAGTDGYARMQQQLSIQPINPRRYNPDIPEGLEGIILKGMQKDPGGRFKDMHMLISALRGISL